MFGRASNGGRIGFPDIGDISIELEFIAIRIEDIQTVCHGVIGGAEDSDAGGFELFQCGAEFLVGIPDFETDMIQAWFRDMFRSGSTTNADEKHLMMGAASGEKSRTAHITFDFRKAEDVAVESARAFEVGDIEDNMTEFVDFHKG